MTSTLKFTDGYSQRVQHAACSETPSLHDKYFRERRRITWLDMNALLRWGLEPRKGLIVFCISISPIIRDDEQSQVPRWQTASGSLSCACACVPFPGAFWLTGNKGHAEIVIHQVRGHAEAEGLKYNCPVFVAVLPAFASSLLWAGNQRLSANEVTTYTTCTQQGTAHF